MNDVDRWHELVDGALLGLADLEATDPAAAPARRAIALTSRTLEWFWKPTISGLTERHGEKG